MGWKHYRTVDPPPPPPNKKGSPRLVGDCLVSFYQFFTSNFNFPIHQIFRIFHIFLNLTYPLRKNISFPKCPEITQKFSQNRQTVIMVISIQILRCLKRDRDIGRKAVLSDIKTAFTCTPALLPFSSYCERQTFFRVVRRLKYSSLSRQTVAL